LAAIHDQATQQQAAFDPIFKHYYAEKVLHLLEYSGKVKDKYSNKHSIRTSIKGFG
jgi:hypothetical protein